MRGGSYFEFMKINFQTFFLWYPLVTLALLPMLFFLYGGAINDFMGIFDRLITMKSVAKYFGILILSYFVHVTYGWYRNKASNRQN